MNDRTRLDGPTPCPLGEEAVAFAMHALEPDEEAAMRAHIERCHSCSETVRETELVGGRHRQLGGAGRPTTAAARRHPGHGGRDAAARPVRDRTTTRCSRIRGSRRGARP